MALSESGSVENSKVHGHNNHELEFYQKTIHFTFWPSNLHRKVPGTSIFLRLKFLVNLKTFHRWSYRCDCHVGYHTPRSDQSYLDIDDMRYNEFDVGNAINCVG